MGTLSRTACPGARAGPRAAPGPGARSAQSAQRAESADPAPERPGHIPSTVSLSMTVPGLFGETKPNMDTFTSESRREYFWKLKDSEPLRKSKRFCNLRDAKWLYREAMIQQR